MRDVKIKKYLKKLDYTYVFGIYPTIELLKLKPNKVIKVLFSSKSQRSQEVANIKKLAQKNGIKTEQNDRLIDKIAFKENTYAVGIMQKYEEELNNDTNHIVLVNPSDMGNLGTIIRSMHAFNFFDLAIIRPGADIFDPRVIRSSMGSLFNIRFSYFYSFNDYKNHFSSHNYYPFVLNAKKALEQVNFQPKFSLIFGNEGEGLDKTFENMENTVRIKQNKGIDSLNLAVSASIAMYKTFS